MGDGEAAGSCKVPYRIAASRLPVFLLNNPRKKNIIISIEA